MEITEFYCPDLFAKIPSNQRFTKELDLTENNLRGRDLLVFPHCERGRKSFLIWQYFFFRIKRTFLYIFWFDEFSVKNKKIKDSVRPIPNIRPNIRPNPADIIRPNIRPSWPIRR